MSASPSEKFILTFITHKITDNYFNYHKEDLHEILKSDVFKYKDDKYIENFIENNLKIYDSIGD